MVEIPKINTRQLPRLEKAVVVSLQFEGFHAWSDCPIEELDFLRDKHRHIFHIRAWKTVSHNDRDIEIILLKREILGYLAFKFPHRNFGNRSCEDIAEILVNEFDLAGCEVLEDGENGAIVSKAL